MVRGGSRVAGYELGELIAQDRLGEVYSATGPAGTQVALRTLDALEGNRAAVARFAYSAEALKRSPHPNIIPVLDFGQSDAVPFVVNPLVAGQSLAELLPDRRPWHDTEEALDWLWCIASGLDHANGLGVFHHNLSPATILFDRRGAPLIGGLGVSALMPGHGNLLFKAPEQLTSVTATGAADRYGLAALAYMILTGYAPIAATNVHDILYEVVRGEPACPSDRNPRLTSAVDNVLLRGLAKEPERRWKSGREFVEELAIALGLAAESEVAGRQREAVETAIDEILPSSLAPAPRSAPAPKGHPRLRVAGYAIAAVMLLTSLSIAAYAVSRGPAPDVSLSTPLASPGQMVTVRAYHVPAGATAVIQISGQRESFGPVKVGSDGRINAQIHLPADTRTGIHEVQICWGGTCQAGAPLTITP